MECRLCHSMLDDALTLIHLGNQAFTGMFLSPEEEVPYGELHLVRCNDCGLAQLDSSFDLNVMYGEHYGYRSGLSKAMIQHLGELTKDISKKVNLETGDQVLDIGCSDGTLLASYPNDIYKVGYDPTLKFNEPPKNMRTFGEFFNVVHYEDHVGGKTKIITAIAMFYDLDDPVAFLKSLKSILDPDGVIVIELQFLPLCVKNSAVDVICHEHLVYYDGKRLLNCIEAAFLELEEVSFNDVNGGTIRVVLKHHSENHNVLKQYISLHDHESWDLKNWERLADFIKTTGETIRKFCEHNATIGLGASTKGNVLLQHWGLTEKHLSMIGEINETKFGKVTPGTNIPIVDENELPKTDIRGRTMTALVLPWWLKDQFIDLYPQYYLLFPLPKPTVVRNGAEISLEDTP